MPNSTYIGKLLGPAIIAVTVTEWMNLDVFMAATGPSFAPHVYLNGTLIFIAGLAAQQAGESAAVLHGSLAALLLVGLVLTYKSYVGGGS